MNISSILSPSRTCAQVSGGSKKRVLETTSKLIAADNPAISADDVFRQFLNRERLGSTGLGNGIAIPHCRIANCAQPVGTLLTLADAIEFEAIDDAPVNIVFALLVPEEANQQHLQLLGQLAKVFANTENLDRLRAAPNDTALYECACELFNQLG